MSGKLRKGITIAEFIGIFAMLGVLCAAITPHLMAIHEASRRAKLRFNLEKLRQRIDEYRQRTGQPPNQLKDAFPDESIPENPLSRADPGQRNQVKVISVSPPHAGDTTKSGLGGWLYAPNTGEVWADAEPLLDE